ncbi:uncharacterized protein LOC101859417 [Aplysia californica]|uniref:Uncharacterized protein LOC101859417 n=1 Tax=Aplysia californica TaxID=6500 RepID=A0ABM0JTM6_APLCA|nr:uncharacterized protein LOC101859417 [Aplysia californica]
MGVYHVVLLALTVASCRAFWLSRGNPTALAEGRAVEESCLALADEGSCEFYTCFENRLPCGRDWYMLRHGQYYCNKMQRLSSTFTDAGQAFLSDAQRCLTQALKPLYQRDNVDCHSLEHQAVAAITPCFIDNAFCSVFRDNTDQFARIYDVGDLFTRGAGKVWREIAALALRCTHEYIRDFSSETHSNVVSSVNGMVDALRDAVEVN